MCSCSHAGRVIWKWWDYYLSSKSILSVLITVGRLHFTLLASMSLVMITKECICVCLCKVGICTILISNMILLWFLSALIYVICCYGYMYSLDCLPISFSLGLLRGCAAPHCYFVAPQFLSWVCSALVFALVSCGYKAHLTISCLSAYLLLGMWHRCLLFCVW